MNHVPSIQTLRAFEAAYRLQNYSRAGEELGLTHGAISHRIRELEARLGVELFVRRGGKMVPSVAARQLITNIGPALRALEHAFETKARPHDQRLRLSVIPGFAACWLVARLGGFTRAHPQVQLRMGAEVDLVELGDGPAELAIRYGLGNWPGLHSEKLADELLFPVCSPAYREKMRIESPADLARATLLQHSWQSWGAWLDAAGLDIPHASEGPAYSGSDLLMKAAEAGHGVALARRFLAVDAMASGRLVKLFDVEIIDAYAYYLVRSADAYRHASVRLFSAWLREEMARTLASSPLPEAA